MLSVTHIFAAALRYAAAIFTEGDGHEAVEPLVTLHNNIPLHQVYLQFQLEIGM